MKSYFLTFFVSLLFIFNLLGQTNAQDDLPLTTVEYRTPKFDFGKVKTGEIVNHRFTFKNTGTKDLFLTWVKPSCGCTTVDYTKEPICPGDEGFIDIHFNLRGRTGHQLKFVWVQTNTKPFQNTLQIEGEAIE